MNKLAIIGYIAAISILVVIASLITHWIIGGIAPILVATIAAFVFASVLQYGSRYMDEEIVKDSDKWTQTKRTK